MKLMRKLLKKNNKGMSLVELICAIAILGLTTTALGGAMVVSARQYQRDSAEFEVQQEAQTATNLIGNLVVDAADAKWEGDVLKIEADGKKHEIYQVGSVLKYKSIEGGVTTEGILAEGVADDGFTADTSNFKTNKSVNIALVLENDGRQFTSNYNATSRNGELSTTEYAERVCVISTEDEVVIEPNQEYKMKVNLLGMDESEVHGLMVDRNGVPSEWNTDDAIKYDSSTKEIIIKAPGNADVAPTTDFTFEIETVDTKPNSSDKWDTKTIQVRIRRVSDIELVKLSGDGFVMDTVYEFKANLSGSNLTRGFGRSYDLYPYAYVDPTQVEFTARTTTGVDLQVTQTGPDTCEVKINTTIPYNESFSVKAVAKHTTGTNKTSTPYTVQDAELYFTNTSPGLPPGVSFPYEFKRGDDFIWKMADHLDPDGWKGDANHVANNVDFRWYVRYSEDGVNWSQFVATKENGINEKISGTDESRVLAIDKKYYVQFVLAGIKNNKLMWPHDASLLSQKGFAEAGVQQGWNDATINPSQKVTQPEQYGGTYVLPAVKMAFYNKVGDAGDNKVGIPEDGTTQTLCIGSKSSPIAYNTDETVKVYFDTLYLAKKQGYTVTPVIWMHNGSSWEEITVDDYFDVGKQVSDDGWITLDVESDKVDEVKGESFRMGFKLGGTYAELKASATLNAPSYDVLPLDEEIPMYSEETDPSGNEYTDGFVYFKYNN